jgi:hypothetical protein
VSLAPYRQHGSADQSLVSNSFAWARRPGSIAGIWRSFTQARRVSIGSETLNDRVLTFHPRVVFRSDALATARNFEAAKRSSLGKDSGARSST